MSGVTSGRRKVPTASHQHLSVPSSAHLVPRRAEKTAYRTRAVDRSNSRPAMQRERISSRRHSPLASTRQHRRYRHNHHDRQTNDRKRSARRTGGNHRHSTTSTTDRMQMGGDMMIEFQLKWQHAATYLLDRGPKGRHWIGRLIERKPWKSSPLFHWMEVSVTTQVGRDSRLCEPLSLLPQQYELWIRNVTTVEILKRTIEEWMSCESSTLFGPLDYRLILQLCFDLDFSDLFATVQTLAYRAAHHRHWPPIVYVCWNSVF